LAERNRSLQASMQIAGQAENRSIRKRTDVNTSKKGPFVISQRFAMTIVCIPKEHQRSSTQKFSIKSIRCIFLGWCCNKSQRSSALIRIDTMCPQGNIGSVNRWSIFKWLR
jgi:hypothetical protein